MTATPWHDYQIEAARFFREAGLSAEVDARVKGVRGEHAVDVLVRGRTASIDQLWVIECKHWQSRVHKAEVATLVSIVQDLGADRGVLLSESGFQAGARSFARQQNVTLTDLKTLRADTADETARFGLETCRDRLLRLSQRLVGITETTYGRNGRSSVSQGRGRASMSVIITLHGGISSALSAIDAARIGRWPVGYLQKDDSVVRAQSGVELLGYLSGAVAEMEALVDQQEVAADAP